MKEQLALGLMLIAFLASASFGSDTRPKNLSALLKQHHGQVLVLLLGTDGCQNTAKATADLSDYMSHRPAHVFVIRFDVPLPNDTSEPKGKWKFAIPRMIDKDRKLADELEFFYYPTLYIFDKDGQKRYVGAYEKTKVMAMIRAMLEEKPGVKKIDYMPPMPGIGETAPAFSGETLAGKAVTDKSLFEEHGLMIIFARTSCPFSAADIPQFKDIADRYSGKGIGVVVVNQREEVNVIKPLYDKQCAGVTVIADQKGDIFKAYGVDAVPFFFLLDAQGKIVACRSFVQAAAVNSIDSLLGLKSETPQTKSTGGG